MMIIQVNWWKTQIKLFEVKWKFSNYRIMEISPEKHIDNQKSTWMKQHWPPTNELGNSHPWTRRRTTEHLQSPVVEERRGEETIGWSKSLVFFRLLNTGWLTFYFDFNFLPTSLFLLSLFGSELYLSYEFNSFPPSLFL